MSTTATVSWQDALSRLRDGNQRFVEDRLDGVQDITHRRGELTGSQHPYAIILSCADSRVVPELAFDAGLGELFVIRVAGNIANSSSIASIEYAVAHLGVKLILVLGHESCGAVTAALSDSDNGYNLNHLLMHIQPARVASDDKSVDAVVRKNAEMTAEELRNRSSIIAGADDLVILPAFYHLDSGRVEILQELQA